MNIKAACNEFMHLQSLTWPLSLPGGSSLKNLSQLTLDTGMMKPTAAKYLRTDEIWPHPSLSQALSSCRLGLCTNVDLHLIKQGVSVFEAFYKDQDLFYTCLLQSANFKCFNYNFGILFTLLADHIIHPP